VTAPPNWDQDAFAAACDLIERTGAKQFEVGYLHDDVPVEKAGWYAHAQYHGARITAQDHPGPVQATEALARQLLEGGVCTYCGLKIALADYPGRRCRWTRQGPKWVRGCAATHTDRDQALVDAGRKQARGPHA
jgi:hypothetical protein